MRRILRCKMFLHRIYIDLYTHDVYKTHKSDWSALSEWSASAAPPGHTAQLSTPDERQAIKATHGELSSSCTLWWLAGWTWRSSGFQIFHPYCSAIFRLFFCVFTFRVKSSFWFFYAYNTIWKLCLTLVLFTWPTIQQRPALVLPNLTTSHGEGSGLGEIEFQLQTICNLQHIPNTMQA